MRKQLDLQISIYEGSEIRQVVEQAKKTRAFIKQILEDQHCIVCNGFGHKSGQFCASTKDMGAQHEAEYFSKRFSELWKRSTDDFILQLKRQKKASEIAQAFAINKESNVELLGVNQEEDIKLFQQGRYIKQEISSQEIIYFFDRHFRQIEPFIQKVPGLYGKISTKEQALDFMFLIGIKDLTDNQLEEFSRQQQAGRNIDTRNALQRINLQDTEIISMEQAIILFDRFDKYEEILSIIDLDRLDESICQLYKVFQTKQINLTQKQKEIYLKIQRSMFQDRVNSQNNLNNNNAVVKQRFSRFLSQLDVQGAQGSNLNQEQGISRQNVNPVQSQAINPQQQNQASNSNNFSSETQMSAEQPQQVGAGQQINPAFNFKQIQPQFTEQDQEGINQQRGRTTQQIIVSQDQISTEIFQIIENTTNIFFQKDGVKLEIAKDLLAELCQLGASLFQGQPYNGQLTALVNQLEELARKTGDSLEFRNLILNQIKYKISNIEGFINSVSGVSSGEQILSVQVFGKEEDKSGDEGS